MCINNVIQIQCQIRVQKISFVMFYSFILYEPFYTSGTMIIGDLQEKEENASQCNVKTATNIVYSIHGRSIK